MLPDPSWQAKTAQAFAVSAVAIDGENRLVRCPQGEASVSWVESPKAHGHEIVHIMFGRKACVACPVRGQCPKSAAGPRTLTLSAQPYHEALQQAR